MLFHGLPLFFFHVMSYDGSSLCVITAVAASAPRKSLGSSSANSSPNSQCSTPGQFQPTKSFVETHLQHVTYVLMILHLIRSKGQVCWWQPGVSSSNTNLAERHRGLLWRSPEEAWEGEPATPGGWGWWRGWRQWDVKGQQEVWLNYYTHSHYVSATAFRTFAQTCW